MTCLMRAETGETRGRTTGGKSLRGFILAVEHQNMPAVTRLSHEGRVCLMRRDRPELMGSRSRHDGTWSGW